MLAELAEHWGSTSATTHLSQLVAQSQSGCAVTTVGAVALVALVAVAGRGI